MVIFLMTKKRILEEEREEEVENLNSVVPLLTLVYFYILKKRENFDIS